MKNEGVIVVSKQLSNQDFIVKLKEKILEETDEVIKASNLEEMTIEIADLLESLEALSKAVGISTKQIEVAKRRKQEANGTFDKDSYIDHIKVAKDNNKVLEYLRNKKRHYVL